MCNCKATEIVLGLVVLVFALYQTSYSKWVIVVAAVLLLIHGLACKDMGSCAAPVKAKPARKKAKKKKRR